MGEDIPSLKKIAESRSLKPLKGIIVQKRYKRMWGSALLVILVGLVILGGADYFWNDYSLYKTWHEDFVVLPKQIAPVHWHLSGDSLLEINATVSGGNGDIRVYVVEDKTGKIVKDFGRLMSPLSVRFAPPNGGNYTVYFDNTFSTIMPKHVKATYAIYTANGIVTSLILGVTGLSLLVLGLIALVRGTPILVIKSGDDVYEFSIGRWYSLRISVNGIKLKDPVKKDAAFKIGPNDEHTLELKNKSSWFRGDRWIFIVDGQEVGRLP